MLNVLFVCLHNSARSQMAEAYLNKFGGNLYTADSAGIEAGKLNPYVVRALAEEEIDISQHPTNSVFDYFKKGRSFDVVVKVCDQATGERCPIFPMVLHQLNWSFTDPSKFEGTDEEIMSQVRVVKNQIKEKILEFIEQYREISQKRIIN
jgi:arsenate reductase (thioredoxin)